MHKDTLDRHSFPTRRSSDLDREGTVLRLRGATADRSRAGGRLRSEEHTSELQSLRHLVCRLLLEKKNMNAVLGMKSLVMEPYAPAENALLLPTLTRQGATVL